MSSPGKDKFDRWLDTALHQYGNGEPRAGLEARVMAHLKSVQSHSFIRARIWALAGSAIVAAVAMCSLWFAGQSKQHQRSDTTRPIVMHPSLDAMGSPDKTRLPSSQAAPKPVRRAARPTRQGGLSSKRPELASEPRLEQFPSPRPLSQEELLFVVYARQFPKEALQIAKEQQNFEKEIREAGKVARNSVSVSDEERMR